MLKKQRKRYSQFSKLNVNPLSDAKEVRRIARGVQTLRQNHAIDWEIKYLVACLYESSKAGSLEVCRHILQTGRIDPNSALANHWLDLSPLHRSLRSGHREIVELLLQFHADVNAVDGMGRTPLYIAVLHGDKQNVDCLLKRGANPSSFNGDGTPLDIARQLKRFDLEELITSFLPESGIKQTCKSIWTGAACKFAQAIGWKSTGAVTDNTSKLTVNQADKEQEEGERQEQHHSEVATLREEILTLRRNFDKQITQVCTELGDLKNQLWETATTGTAAVRSGNNSHVLDEGTLTVHKWTKLFCFMSSKIGKDWMFLGRELQLTDSRLEEIEEMHRAKGIREFSYQMLRSWQEQSGPAASVSVLTQALNAAGRKGLQERVRSFLRSQ